LTNTKLAEDHIEKIFGGGLADYFSDGINGDPQVHRRQIKGGAGAQSLNSALRGRAPAIERILMTRIDHDLQHLRFYFSRPHQVLDRIFERLDPLASKA